MKPPSALLLLAAFSLSVLQPFILSSTAATVINEGFEKGIPRDLIIDGTEVAIDTTRAKSGRASLRVTPKSGVTYNAIRYELDGRVNLSAGCEFTFWVYMEKKATFSAYISM